VTHGYHAVAIDEQRDDFQPTLWQDSPAARQVLFAGAHSDIGGGYPLAGESGLSDIALQWMIERLGEAGVRFAKTPMIAFEPDPLATSHMPWLRLPWSVPPFMSSARKFPAGMEVDPSVAVRMAAATVFADAGGRGGPYKPGNLPV
jgi:glutathione S-transferase